MFAALETENKENGESIFPRTSLRHGRDPADVLAYVLSSKPEPEPTGTGASLQIQHDGHHDRTLRGEAARMKMYRHKHIVQSYELMSL